MLRPWFLSALLLIPLVSLVSWAQTSQPPKTDPCLYALDQDAWLETLSIEINAPDKAKQRLEEVKTFITVLGKHFQGQILWPEMQHYFFVPASIIIQFVRNFSTRDQIEKFLLLVQKEIDDYRQSRGLSQQNHRSLNITSYDPNKDPLSLWIDIFDSLIKQERISAPLMAVLAAEKALAQYQNRPFGNLYIEACVFCIEAFSQVSPTFKKESSLQALYQIVELPPQSTFTQNQKAQTLLTGQSAFAQALSSIDPHALTIQNRAALDQDSLTLIAAYFEIATTTDIGAKTHLPFEVQDILTFILIQRTTQTVGLRVAQFESRPNDRAFWRYTLNRTALRNPKVLLAFIKNLPQPDQTPPRVKTALINLFKSLGLDRLAQDFESLNKSELKK